ncbi:gamma-glutamylcyclotransferase family protein [Nioella nitratireducens]|uniref:gamma-glutamylcyclotransferase family protein n=1 Tax=Nioella nitratireducens TaxID=1287720 RepID=UPI0008FD867D|nr:gamma-glutamylcyclotransferase family protein [Nioella nitratireducens]
MSDPFFFGYGSLVNRSTHAYPRAAQATVTGWARAWKKSKLRKVAFLTAVEAHGEEIDGLIAAVPGSDWAALDERERAYDRLPVAEIRHSHPTLPDIQIYRARADHIEHEAGEHVLLLSYLDVVVQGYLREFGVDGAERFFATTHDWTMPICDDRADPVYPRHQNLTNDERAYVDGWIRRIGAEVTDRRP